MNHNKLHLNELKCFKMHVRKASECCPILKVDGNEMKSVDRERYLGDILTSDGKINNNIEERVNKGFGKVNDIPGFHFLGGDGGGRRTSEVSPHSQTVH